MPRLFIPVAKGFVRRVCGPVCAAFVRALALTCALVCTLTLAAPAHAANSGGTVVPKTNSFAEAYTGDYQVGTGTGAPTASGGNVFIDQDFAGHVLGGYAKSDSGAASATNNSVSMSGGAVRGDVYGGYANSTSGAATATGNSVVISGGTVTAVIGGRVKSDSGAASTTGNSVRMSGGTVRGVFGGWAQSSSGATSATDNSVSISGGTVSEVYGGWATSSSGTASVTGNSVVIRGGTVGGVFGGRAESTSGAASATDNSVVISGGTVEGTVYGGWANSGSGTASATGNSVRISGGTVGGNVFGGTASSSSAASATGNSVVISGGTVKGNVYGGQAVSGIGTANATGNSVTIMGAPVFGATTTLYGGFKIGSGTGDIRSGNTLNIFTSGITVGNMLNFQHYNFALFGGGGAGLTLTGNVPSVPPIPPVFATFEPGDVVRVPYALPGQKLAVGHSSTLLSTTNSIIGLDTTGLLPAGQAKQGVALVYDYTLTRDTNSITATINGVSLAPESKAMSEGRAAAIGFANLGADLIAGAGMDAVRSAAAAHSGKGLSGGSGAASGLIPFFAMQGSSLRYNTGSHVDVNGVALMTGLAKKWQAPTLDVLAGVFFEAAFGSYKTHNSIGGLGSVDGKGDTGTLGGGLLARLDMTGSALKGLYAEGSFRIGSLRNNYKNNDLRDGITGNTAQYDITSTYYGAHAGLGYIWNVTDKASLDVYGKYFWTHQQGQDVRILGDTFSFKDADSHRTRLGARLSYAVTESITPYIGAAWEHEFDGKTRATVYGYDVPGPSLKGSTGVGEIGLTWKPDPTGGLSVDAGLQGYVGQRQGVSGSVQLRYEF